MRRLTSTEVNLKKDVTEAFNLFLKASEDVFSYYWSILNLKGDSILDSELLFGFVVVNDSWFQRLLLYFDYFSDGLILKSVFVFVFPFLYN